MDFLIRTCMGGLAALGGIAVLSFSLPVSGESSLLHVSFDATREVLLEVGLAFETQMRQEGKPVPFLTQSHGGSGSQARAIVAGLPADLVSLAVWPDLATIVNHGSEGLVAPAWLKVPCPWFTTMVFVVRKGNPKNIRSWEDLARPDVRVIIPNPKVSGNGKLAFLALLGACKTLGKSPEETEDYLRNIFSRVPALESTSRAATLSFATKGLGDIQITYESEAELVLREGLLLEKVVPDRSIRAPLPLAPVIRPGQSPRQREWVREYLAFFASEKAQEILVRHGFRPGNAAVHGKHSEKFKNPALLFTVEEIAGSWDKANRDYFGHNGLFDRVMAP